MRLGGSFIAAFPERPRGGRCRVCSARARLILVDDVRSPARARNSLAAAGTVRHARDRTTHNGGPTAPGRPAGDLLAKPCVETVVGPAEDVGGWLRSKPARVRPAGRPPAARRDRRRPAGSARPSRWRRAQRGRQGRFDQVQEGLDQQETWARRLRPKEWSRWRRGAESEGERCANLRWVPAPRHLRAPTEGWPRDGRCHAELGRQRLRR